MKLIDGQETGRFLHPCPPCPHPYRISYAKALFYSVEWTSYSHTSMAGTCGLVFWEDWLSLELLVSSVIMLIRMAITVTNTLMYLLACAFRGFHQYPLAVLTLSMCKVRHSHCSRRVWRRLLTPWQEAKREAETTDKAKLKGYDLSDLSPLVPLCKGLIISQPSSPAGDQIFQLSLWGHYCNRASDLSTTDSTMKVQFWL